MPKIIPLESGNFYHIFNHGVGGRKLFREKGNYEHFLKQYHKYIDPVVDTYAWTLMPNHFHWLVRVKEDVGGLEITPDRSAGGSVSAGRRTFLASYLRQKLSGFSADINKEKTE